MSQHRHHLVPKHAGGDNDPLNLTPPISKRLHAMFHYDRWKVLREPEDLAACHLLLGIISCGEARLIASIEGRRLALAAMTPEERKVRWGKGLGKKASEKTRAKMSHIHLNRERKPHTEEGRRNISLAKKASGWKPSESHKQKIGLAAVGNKHRLGVKWTEEQKKMFRHPNPAVSESNRRRASLGNKMRIEVLDHGYVEKIEAWGSDERIVEAARMSTGKGFLGWGPTPCPQCRSGDLVWGTGQVELHTDGQYIGRECPTCKGTGKVPGDEKLLKYLWEHHHTTPFEMGGMTIEVQAPIFVFREWHRHRTQSYNELSARYTPLPDVNYRPSRERIIEGALGVGNKQASGTKPLLIEAIDDWLQALDAAYAGVEQTYQVGLQIGIPKEVARVILPVGRYSRMRASTDLWNWLHFLKLRMDKTAQWEIRQYANVVGKIIAQQFPRTWALFQG